MPSLLNIRAAIQGKILAPYPQLTADASEPYCRLICRRALSLAGKDAAKRAAHPNLSGEREILEATFAEEMAALRHALSTVSDRIVARAGDDERRATCLALQTFDAFIHGGARTTQLSLEAIRARVDTTLYLVSRWGGHEDELPVDVYAQHRAMIWLLALGYDAPGLLNPCDPGDPEQCAEMCEMLFQVEIAALKALFKNRVMRGTQRAATKAQAMAQGKVVMDALRHQFVDDHER
jgi:hypothetical protein